MEKKYEFPRIVNNFLELELCRRARLQIKYFQKIVMPILTAFAIDDDMHIRKFLGEQSFEAIYFDICRERPDYLRFYVAHASQHDGDFWKEFRSNSCKDKLCPTDEGFKFRDLPHYYGAYRDIILSAITIEGGKFSCDETLFTDYCVIKPTKKQEEIFNIASELCAKLSELNIRRSPTELLRYNDRGQLVPNVKSIAGFLF